MKCASIPLAQILRSAEEHFVEKKPERSCRLGNSAQLYATTPIDEASFWLMPLRFNSILLYRPQVDRPLE